jgi:hypothetical protein
MLRPARTIVPTFPAGTSAASAGFFGGDGWRITITPNGQHVVFTAGGGAFLVSASVDGAEPARVHALSEGLGSVKLAASPDSSHVLAVGFERSWQKLDLTSTTSALGPVVVSALDHYPDALLESYDGWSFFATSSVRGTNAEVIASVDAATGGAKVLAQDLEWPSLLIGNRGAHLWYLKSRQTSGVESWTIERLSRAAGEPSKVIATFPQRGVASLSEDGSAIVYRTGQVGRPELFSVASDGSDAPRHVWSGPGATLSRLRASANRTLYLSRETDGKEFYLLIDDRTGQIVFRHEKRPSSALTMLSGDGEYLYAERKCLLGSVNGYEVVRHGRADEQVLLPCSITTKMGGMFTAVPASSAVFYRVLGGASASGAPLVLLHP